jgi:hypothetical protein
VFVGVLFAVCVIAAGYGVVRGLGLAKSVVALGLAPATGLGTLIVLTTWAGFLRLPPLAGALLILATAGIGFLHGALDRDEWRGATTASAEVRASLLLLGLGLVVPVVILATSLFGVTVPVSSHDGAYHVEVINLLRYGGRWDDWYPSGFHRLAAAFLQLFPNVDSAEGSLGIGMGLAVLAPLGVFGLGLAVLRRLSAAAAGCALVALTAHYPYEMQLWDGWPLATTLILVTGIWAIAAMYVERPRAGLAVLGGVLLSGVVLTHGTELYTLAIGLACLTLASLRKLEWRGLVRHLPLALLLGVVLAAPYIPALTAWTQGNGAQAVGAAEFTHMSETGSALSRVADTLHLALDTVSAALIDAPLRLVLLSVGIAASLRMRTGRVLVVIGLLFLGLALAFQAQLPALQPMYAATFPWGENFRLLLLTSICAGLLSGLGLVELTGWVRRLRHRGARRIGVVLAIVSIQLSAVLLATSFAIVAREYVTATADDDRAFGWLHDHVKPGDIIANDGRADAGIWAPYKTGATILSPRVLRVAEPEMRATVAAEVGHLDDDPGARSAACELGVRYVFAGAITATNETRAFPSAAELRQSTALNEVFTSGDAAVFELQCPG